MHRIARWAAVAVFETFEVYRARSASLARRATVRFEARDWRGVQADAIARVDVYRTVLDSLESEIRGILGGEIMEKGVWAEIKAEYSSLIAPRLDREIAETWFNSLGRRIFHTVGIDPSIEFFDRVAPEVAADHTVYRTYGAVESVDDLIDAVLRDCRFQAGFVARSRSVELAGQVVTRKLSDLGIDRIERAEVIDVLFYRGQGAYVVGRLVAGDTLIPMALAMHHEPRGIVVGAVLLDESDLSILFSYTRSAFQVVAPCPAALVAFLRSVLPHKPVSELYSAIGFDKHAKTELYRDILDHVDGSDEQFAHAPGAAGLVMIVFTIPGFDFVFKVIRDHFAFPKQTTRRQVMSKYRIVFRHDRAGRLIDAHEFELLAFDRGRFAPELLDELAREATTSVTIGTAEVVLDHVYIERRVTPLDLYLRSVGRDAAVGAILDYGRAIKNLAASNIFPGDLLTKNFGVTGQGRVVFYDYDELTFLAECNFRAIPDTDDVHDEMSADPWFGTSDRDVFPEEFPRFLGVTGELRRVFDRRHGDLFEPRFWKRVQQRIHGGEVIEIFPYRRELRLGVDGSTR